MHTLKSKTDLEYLPDAAKKLEDEWIEALWNEDPRAEFLETQLKIKLQLIEEGKIYEPLF
jgi:hypothetical protein